MIKKKLLISIIFILGVIAPSLVFAQDPAPVTVPATIPAPNLVTNFQLAMTRVEPWLTTLTVGNNSNVSWLLSYQNNGNGNVNELKVSATLPPNHTLVPDSVLWYDGNHPNGEPISNTEMFNEEQGLGIVAPGGNGYIKYQTRTIAVACGNTYKPIARFNVDGVIATKEVTVTTPACPAPPAQPVAPAQPTTPTQPTPPAQPTTQPTTPAQPTTPTTRTTTTTTPNTTVTVTTEGERTVTRITDKQASTTRKVAAATTEKRKVAATTDKEESLSKTGIDISYVPVIVAILASAAAYGWIYFRQTFLWELGSQLVKYYRA